MEEKEAIARRLVDNYVWWSIGAGLIDSPFADLIAIARVHLKMLAQIARIYESDYQESRASTVLASLLTCVVPSALSFGPLGGLPNPNTAGDGLSAAVFCGASAYALGRKSIQHFKSGGTMLSFDPERERADFQQEFDEGLRLASSMLATGNARKAA